jgi:hypothetical protein
MSEEKGQGTAGQGTEQGRAGGRGQGRAGGSGREAGQGSRGRERAAQVEAATAAGPRASDPPSKATKDRLSKDFEALIGAFEACLDTAKKNYATAKKGWKNGTMGVLESKELLLDTASCYAELIKLQEAAQEDAATGKYIMEVLVLKEHKYILETMYREFEDVALENLRKRLWSKYLKLGWSGQWCGIWHGAYLSCLQ